MIDARITSIHHGKPFLASSGIDDERATPSSSIATVSTMVFSSFSGEIVSEASTIVASTASPVPTSVADPPLAAPRTLAGAAASTVVAAAVFVAALAIFVMKVSLSSLSVLPSCSLFVEGRTTLKLPFLSASTAALA